MVVQHRVGAALSLACGLVALALIPALQPVVSAPPLPRPQPVVAPAGLVPISTGPTRPVSSDDASPPPHTAMAPISQPWHLRVNDTEWPGPQPMLQGKYDSHEACLTALQQRYGPTLQLLEQQAKGGVKHIKITRDPGKWRWETMVMGHQAIREAWCAKQD